MSNRAPGGGRALLCPIRLRGARQEDLSSVGKKEVRRQQIPGAPHGGTADGSNALTDGEGVGTHTAPLHANKIRDALDSPELLFTIVVGNANREANMRIHPVNLNEITLNLLNVVGIVRSGVVG